MPVKNRHINAAERSVLDFYYNKSDLNEIALNTTHRNSESGNPHKVTVHDLGLANIQAEVDLNSAKTSNIDHPVVTGNNTGDQDLSPYTLLSGASPFTGPVSMPFQSSASASRNSNQVIGNGTWTTIIYSSEISDLNNEYDPATGLFTCADAGTYIVHGSASYYLFLAAKDYYLSIEKNSTGIVTARHNEPTGGNLLTCWCNGVFVCAAGDTLSMATLHNSGVNKNIFGAAYSHISIARVA